MYNNYNNSVAQNHISELARQGRYGDDMLVHMNKEEAATLARAAGLDKLPINPQTGLPEAFAIMGAIAVGKGLLGAYSSIKGAQEEGSQARAQSQMISQQMRGIDESIAGLDGVKDSKEEVARQEYSQQLGDLSMQTGQSKEDLQQQYQQAIQKSGLATSGGTEARSSQQYRRIQQQFGRGSQSLLGNLGKSMASVEEWYEGEKSRLGSEKQRLEHEKRTADAQAKSAKGRGIMGAVGAGLGAAASIFGGG